MSWLLATSALAQTGTGLTGKYYDATDFVTAVTTRTDAGINFNFGTSVPSGTAITAANTYAIAWSGQIESAYSELYTFFVTADDAARLWVDDQLIVQRTFMQGTGEMRGQIRLKAGHRTNIRLEFIQETGNASVKLEWTSPSQPKQVVPTNRLYTTTEVPNGGSVMREVWHGLAGASISTMTSNANYPSKPASREFLTSFECLARDWEDGFGTRVTGFIRAPVSGSYTFAVSGDEVVQLYLSTDATSANKALIASTTTATAFRDFGANASQQSAPRTLVGGQRYYVELLHKEDTGADHWSVGWKQPGDSAFSIIPGTALMMPGTDTAQPSTANFFNTLATEQPRLGVSRERFVWLKQQYLSPTASAAKSRATAVISMANSDLTAIPDYGRGARDKLERLALAWWLTDDPRYAEAAWVRIDFCINNDDWTNPWKGVSNGVVAVGYDWFYPYWSQARKDAMTSCMINKGFNSGWTDSYTNNIGVLINSGHLEAILAVGLVNESAGEGKIGSAIARLNSKVDKWNANAGAWYEGTDYGILTKWGFGQAMPAMEMALGSTFGISRIVGVSAAAQEPLTIASNNRQRFTFSDVGTGSEAAIGWANWWARRFDALETFDYSRQIGNSALNALTLPETTLSPATSGFNPDTAYRGPADSAGGDFAEVVTMRENWTDSKATFVGGMGGAFDSHGHLQSGTFQLSARGVKWFVDLTSESYDVPNHNGTTPNPNGPDRWDYYRWRAEGHNCLIVNPTNMPDRIWNAPYAPMLNYQSAQNGQRSFATWDLTNNITGVTKVQRGIQLFNNRKQVLIQDEIVHPTPTTCWWFGHFRNDLVTATIGGDGTSVTLQSGTERLWGKIVSGGGQWTVRAARPLPTSPNPAEANPNTLFSKLAIQLNNVTSTTLAVWFVPLAPGETPPTTTPAITALNTWNLVAQNEAAVLQNGGANSIGGAAVDVDLRTLVTDDWTPVTQLTFAASSAVGGTVTILPDGYTARFTPTPGFTGTQSFTFTAIDADGATSNPATITIGASPVMTNWTSAAGGSWSEGSNWQGNTAPVSGRSADIQFFNGQTLSANTIAATNDLAGTTEANKLTFSGTGTVSTVVNVEGSPLKLVRNGATSPTITLSGVTAGFRYHIANDITLDDSVTINASNTGTFVFNGAITGSGGLTRTGTSSTLILAGNNTYTGTTTIGAGSLQIGNDGPTGALGSGSVTNNGQLRIDRTGTLDVPNDISGSGSLLLHCPTSNDLVRLSGNNSFAGEVRLSGGMLRITDGAQLGSGTKNVVIDGASASLRLDGSAGDIALPETFRIFSNITNDSIINEAGNNVIAGPVSLAGGSGGRRITSIAGTLILDGIVTTNTFGRTLDLRGASNGVINGSILDGSVTNTLGTVSKSEAGTWTLNGDNNFTGGTTVNAGRLVINGTHTSGAVTVAAAATLAGRGTLSAATTVNGTLAPGDGIGTMTVNNTLSFGSTGNLQWELGSNALAGDRVVCTGAITATAGAKIDVVLDSPGSSTTYVLSFWRSARIWPVLSGASLSGTFTLGTVSGDAAGHATATYGAFSLQHTATGVNLVWTPIPGFPIIDEPIVTFTQPTANPAALPNVESRLRIAAVASGGGTINYVWSVVTGEGGGAGTVTFDDANAADTTVVFSDPGTYTLRCTASNEAVSRFADLIVLVEPATTAVLQEDLDGYNHRASYLMGNSISWNHGADPQMRVGRNGSAGQRAVLGFPLNALPAGSVIRSATLDVWTDNTSGVGTVNALELHQLTRSFVEGTGNGSASSNGSGSGVTWSNYNPTAVWTTAGGDFASGILSSVAGYDSTTTSSQKTFPSTLDLVAVAQAALDADASLELIVLSPATEANTTANNYSNLKSNNHADATQRPRLTLGFTFNSLPGIDPGSVGTAGVAFPLALNGVVTFATNSAWSLVSGPGTATFANSASPTTSVVFSTSGSYTLRLSASNALGEVSRDLVVLVSSLPSGFAVWQATNWPGVSDVTIIGPNADPDGDGVTNAIEFNAGTNPTSAASVPSFMWNRMSSGAWSSAGSWNLGAAPVSNTATKIEFFTALNPRGGITANNDIGVGMTLQSLSLNGVGSGSTSISGGGISFASGGALGLNSEGIDYAISLPVTFNAATSISGSSEDALTLSGAVGGSGSVTKSGAFDLIINGPHSGSGNTSINAGAVIFGGGTSSTGNYYLSGGTLGYTADTTGVRQIFFGTTAGDADGSVLDIAANVTTTGITVQTNGDAINTLKIATGKTFTLNGSYTAGGLNAATGNSNLTSAGNGSLAMNFGTNAIIRRGSVLNLSSLGALTMTGTNLNIGDLDNYTTGNPSQLTVPANGPAMINANMINLDSAGVGGGTARGESATLLAPAGSGTLTIRGSTGGTSTANLFMDKHGGTGTGASVTLFDTRGHAADIMLGTLEISRRSGSQSSGTGTGSFYFDSGTLSVTNLVTMAYTEGNADNSALLSLGGGTATFSAGITLASVTSANTNAGGIATLNISGTANVTSGPITLGVLTGTATGRSSTATLNVTGGTLTMTGDVLKGDTSGTGTATSVLNLNGGTLDLGGNDIGSIGTLIFASGVLKNVASINGAGGLTKTGTGTLTLDGAMSYTGVTTISAGTLRVGAATGASTATSLATSSSIINDGTLIFRRTDTADIDVANSISGAGIVIYEGSGSINQSRYTVNNASTFTGGTTIMNARVNLTNATALGTGTVHVNSGASVFVNGAGTVTNDFSIAGNGWIETAGQLGALRLASGSVLTGAITLTANARIGPNLGASTISGPITGAFALEIGEDTAPGTLNLTGPHTYTGDTTISFGVLNLGGTLTSNIANNATLAPQGSPGTSGSLANNGTYRVRLNAGSNDRLTVGTTVTLGGTLDLVPAVGLSVGTSFTILAKSSDGAIAGTFSTRAQNSTWTEDGYLWQISYTGGDGNDVTVTIIPTPSFETWLTNYPTLTGNNALPTADPDGDGIPNLMEYATAMNPTLHELVVQSATISTSAIDFVYTKNKSATDLTYIVEWSDTLANDWSTAGVGAPDVLTDNGVIQQVKVTVPVGSGVTRRFVRLKVTQ